MLLPRMSLHLVYKQGVSSIMPITLATLEISAYIILHTACCFTSFTCTFFTCSLQINDPRHTFQPTVHYVHQANWIYSLVCLTNHGPRISRPLFKSFGEKDLLSSNIRGKTPNALKPSVSKSPQLIFPFKVTSFWIYVPSPPPISPMYHKYIPFHNTILSNWK